MKNILSADRILENLKVLNGFRTKLELAEYFGVCPSSITDWVSRKGNRIPERRLVRLASERGLSWRWLAHGEGEPYEERTVDEANSIELNPDEVRLIRRVKASPLFKRAVSRLLNLGEPEVALLARVAESMTQGADQDADRHAATGAEPNGAGQEPYLKWNGRAHLTSQR